VADPAGLVDLAPTIAELCRIPQRFTQSFQSHPLVGAEEYQGSHSVPGVYAESYYPRNTFGWHELRAIITPRYKYIDAPRPELYDLEDDSDETHHRAAGQSALAVGLREQLQALEGRYANTSLRQDPNPLDSETLEKLRSLGYVGYPSPAPGSDSRVIRADPKDKILVLGQMLHAGDLRSRQRFGEADKTLTSLE